VFYNASKGQKKGDLRTIYTVPAGHGKSRIIAGLIRLFSTKTSKSYKINVIYNDETLKTRD